MKASRVFLLAGGGAVGLLAVLGFVLDARGESDLFGVYLLFDAPHNVAHAVLAIVALGAGLAPLPEKATKGAALGLGLFYLLLAVLGFAHGGLWGYPQRLGWKVHMELGENLAHLILGGWGAYVGSQDSDA